MSSSLEQDNYTAAATAWFRGLKDIAFLLFKNGADPNYDVSL
jgi:hypothetical protein